MRTSRWCWWLALASCGGDDAATPTSGGDERADTGAATSSTDATSEAQGTDPTAGESSASTTEGATTDGTDEGGSEDTGAMPTTTDVCDGDGVCDRDADETCAACPADCGSCEIEDLPDQTARYVDGACTSMGDGALDACADAPGGPGRFNEMQTALDSLVAGDTLYVHPGDYWRHVDGSDSGAVYTLSDVQDGTAERPIVVTAADRDAPPVFWSCNPDGTQDCPAPALAAYGDHVIFDHLAIVGRVQIWGGSDSSMQYLDCREGWGACGDGNWSCLRIESSVRGHAHHNFVHDIGGAGIGGACDPGVIVDFEDRGSGLKEFSSDATIWEFNTVLDPPRWGYDLHRNSLRTTVRFNEFRGFQTGANVNRTVNPRVYGNVFVGAGSHGCVGIGETNEDAPGEPHLAEVHHNTCLAAQTGYAVQWQMPARVQDNVVHGLVEIDEPPRNVAIEVIETADRNAYDAAGNYRRVMYEPETWSATLAEWQAATGQDAASLATEGGACTFADDPNDLRIEDGPCATLDADGGPVGAYGLTTCVGSECP